MERDYEIILNEDGKTKCVYMTIKRKHKTIFQCLMGFMNELMREELKGFFFCVLCMSNT